MSDNKFGLTCTFKKFQFGTQSIVWNIQSFGTTLGTMIDIFAPSTDVGATLKEIRTQANQQTKLVRKLRQAKIKPIDEKAPRKFFAMEWSPNAMQRKWFPGLKDQQGKKSGGDDAWINLWTVAPNQETLMMTGVMVLYVANDQHERSDNQFVQFEFDAVKEDK